jgi:uncharacterized protein YodC (DUF2158 family)
MAKFKKGDCVQLISGGPPMTIDRLPSDTAHYKQKSGEYYCRWFKGATEDSGSFGEHLLVAYTPPSK